jgi:glycosyltransferase involved in cell wall biosynthesis
MQHQDPSMTSVPGSAVAAAVGVTVVIPTYNGASRVGDVLEGLAGQDAEAGSFEVVVIDNNSTDGTAAFVERHPAVLQLAARGIGCRVVLETRQGLAFARIRGVQSANAGYVCFLDDDTVPDASYIREGIGALDADAGIGLLVSRVRPRYDAAVPPSIARREHLFAINERLGNRRLDFGATPTMAPTLGAGLWVRRTAFLSTTPWETPGRMLPDRIGNTLVSGNDIEIGYLIGRGGFKRVYVPGLGLEHRIPARRLKAAYVVRLIEGIVRSAMTLDERYTAGDYTVGQRIGAAASLAAAIAATPVLLCRRDGLRESLFVLASRWARLRGPFRGLAPDKD